MIKRKKLLLLFLFLSGLYLLYNNYYKLFEYYYGSTKRQRLPQALIIGVRKGGTRALINALSLHPSIKAARKEQHYFDYDDNYEKGIDWYRNQMPKTDGNQITIEKTPGYFPSLEAPFRVFKTDPNMKIIIIVRDPVERLISDFTQVLSIREAKNKSSLNFESSIFDKTQKLNLKFKPVLNSLFSTHLQNWLQYFSFNQIWIVDGDNFIINPISELQKVEKFLGLSAEIEASQITFDAQKGFFCFAKKCLGEGKGRKHISVDQRVRSKLARLFRSFNQQFYRQINHTFNW